MSDEFKFDPKQEHQLAGISSVVDLFDGQPRDADALVTKLKGSIRLSEGEQAALDYDLTQEVGALGNNLVLDHETILQNLRAVQDRNGLEVRDDLAEDALDFDIEMETGTGTVTLSIKYDEIGGRLYFNDYESLTQDSIKVDSTITSELVINFINKWKDHI